MQPAVSEVVGGGFGSVPVAGGDVRAAAPQFPGVADWCRVAFGVDDLDLGVHCGEAGRSDLDRAVLGLE